LISHKSYNEGTLYQDAISLKSVETILAKENILPNEIDVLKVGHHGAEDATSEAFLARINPRYAVITGSGNTRHPYQHPDILKRLEKYSKRVFITHQFHNIPEVHQALIKDRRVQGAEVLRPFQDHYYSRQTGNAFSQAPQCALMKKDLYRLKKQG
jgi:hypothetical protein